MIPVFRPQLPSADELGVYLAQMDSSRWYSNYGPLVRRFEFELESLFGAESGTLVTCNNATMALVQALLASIGGRVREMETGYCIIPSWTFVASPAAAMAAGLTPYFADVTLEGWALDPVGTEALVGRLRAQGKRVSAVMPVASFGGPIDIEGWEQFKARTGIPVVVDAAAGFDLFCGPHRPSPGTLPIVVSLHATKSFGIGEGGFVLTGDEEMAKHVRAWGNFGFYQSRTAEVPGINTKMSELSAAVGLALLQRWSDVRRDWSLLTEAFQARVRAHAFLTPAPVMGPPWISSYGLVQFADPSINLPAVVRSLARQGIETRRWWEEGCHLQPAYVGCNRDSLPNTDLLARSVLGLPFWRGLGAACMTQVFEGLAIAVAEVTAGQ